MMVKSIYTGCTSKGINEFKNALYWIGQKEDCVYARVRYIPSRGIRSNNSFEYPLVVYTSSGAALCLADVTAGCSGTGPHGMIELLDYLGFDFYEEDILTRQELVSLDLLKPGYSLKDEFKEFKIPERWWETPFTKIY